MKNLLKYVLPFWAVVILYSCDKEPDQSSMNGKVVFGMEINDTPFTRTSDTESPDAESDAGSYAACVAMDAEVVSELRAVLVLASGKIENHENNENPATYTISIRKDGDSYMTVPLDLAPGNYVLKSFSVVQGGNVIYSGVDEESTFAGLVSVTLPVGFAVSDQNLSQIEEVSVSVLCQNIINSSDFGFGIFDLDFYTLYTVDYLVFDNFLRVGGNLEIQKQEAKDAVLGEGETAFKDEEWIDKGNAIEYQYNATSVTTFSFVDDLQIENSRERYKFTYTPATATRATAEESGEVGETTTAGRKSLALTLPQLLEHIDSLKNEEKFQYVLMDVTFETVTWEVR